MHAKKKNKKANKPPNPNPPQNVVKTEEKLEELAPQCEVKQEILPPEIQSEVKEKSVCEVKEIESETPKKPKRNKGKDKIQDKEEIIEVQDKVQEVQAELIAKVEEPLEKVAIEDKECEEKNDPLKDEANVMPNARKKKNKKKLQEKAIEEIKTLVDSDTTKLKEKVTEHVEKVDTEIQELFSSKPDTPKLEGKKKRNKKKNRTDSERSDKSDNVLSCTTAFQNILSADSSNLEHTDNIVEIIDFITDTKPELEEAKTSAVETTTVEEIKEIKVDSEETKELCKTENKNKKKNKKDKKQQQKEVIEELKHDLSEKISLPTEDILPETILSAEPKQDVKESLHMSCDTEQVKESSPKPKANIAKPVEKKRKGKTEATSSDNLLYIERSEILEEDKNMDKLPKEPKPKLEETSTVEVIKSQVEDQVKQQLPVAPSLIANISVPSDHTMGKKRKKSPKPHKNRDNSGKGKVELESEIIPSEVKSERIQSAEVILDLQAQSQICISEPIDMPLTLPDAITEEKLKPQNEPIIDLAQTILLERPLTPETTKDNEGFETKTSKKKKKTPKIPQFETTLEMQKPNVEITKTENKEQISEEIKQIGKEQPNIPVEPHLAVDVSLQSLATESGVSSCDIIPDDHFMRSSSQHLLDSNNNTVVQEVINVEEIKLNDPELIPLIEGSGATPARTPEPITSGIRVTEIEATTAIEEKTDIKSKMMEVNQDMEELRLSIERSLAEFTALEKTDQELEKVSISVLKKELTPVKENKKGKVTEKTTPEVKENIAEVEKIKESEKTSTILMEEVFKPVETPPICPARKDNKSKNKSKKKGKQESTTAVTTTTTSESSTSQSKDNTKQEQKDKSEKTSEQKSESSSENKGKQQSTAANDNDTTATSTDNNKEKKSFNSEFIHDIKDPTDFEPIDNFEDALTSSIDDVNKTFEMIAKDADDDNIEYQKKLAANKPEINITTAEETDTNRNEKVNPVSQPKNLLGHTDIPVQSSKSDYKKEKNKTPNARQATVKIKDSVDIETKKQCKESQTDNKKSRKVSDKSVKESFSRVQNENDEYVYKYSFRKVFLQSACHVCNKGLGQVRVPCAYCNLLFYCGAKHKDEDWPQHQALCFAVSTLAHMKDQKHIYADAANTTGQDYRLLRMQMIVSCEKVLKRRLVPWEQEVMLYPRMCADAACREWQQGKLKDCDGCGQLSYCAARPDHLPKAHARWCNSYSLYQKLVSYQQTKGRLEPRLPTKVLTEDAMPAKMNEVLATMYEEKIDMNDIQYASLTQLGTAPLSTAYCLQLCRTATGITDGVHKKHPFTIHVVGAELQFEADALNKWETFFLHLRPNVEELRVVLISPLLNPGNLPLDLLGRIKLCDNCQQNKRRVIFKFEDNKNYFEYRSSEDFINPDIICAFNPNIQRSAIYNGKDPWPASINTILKLKTPFIVTSYTLNELRKDIARIKQVSELDFKLISEPGFNNFASVRPDRNFISDDEMPLLFKNYCIAVVLGC